MQWVDEFGQGQKVLVRGSHLPLFFPTSFASPVHDSVQFILLLLLHVAALHPLYLTNAFWQHPFEILNIPIWR